MNIDPAATQILDRMPIHDQFAIPFSDPSEDKTEAGRLPATPWSPGTGAASLSAIEKQFAQLVRDLTQQLNGLERQLSQALRALGAAKAKPARDPDECPQRQPLGAERFHRYGNLINDAARKHEVDPLLVGAVIRHESGFAPTAVSKTGAMGLMQLMPETAQSLGVRDAFDPGQNIEGGTALLRQMLDRYHGHVDLALAAYNAGPAAVDKYGGIPPYPETQSYVRNVMESYREAALSA
jgi:soluble lytic murein transglycosylase-like protein